MLNGEIAVIGSGPGGAMTAALLAEAGRDVTIFESGNYLELNSAPHFTQLEMLQKYRNGGVTFAFGNPKISYVEGACVGGGSEINSGLYHRTPISTLYDWQSSYAINDFDEKALLPFFEQNEKDLCVSQTPKELVSLASLKLDSGAKALGWQSVDVPRWFKYSSDGSGIKQSMTQTMIPRALVSGATLHDKSFIRKLNKVGKYWQLEVDNNQNRLSRFMLFEKVFVCGGAISSAQLLSRSKLSKLAGKTLHMHPSIKLIARFRERINSLEMGVPTHQIKEFLPKYSLGCSISTPSYLSLGMMDVMGGEQIVDSNWQNMAIYYAMVTDGIGRIQNTIFGYDPLVKYQLSKLGYENILDGMEQLGEILFAAGAIELYPTIRNSRPISSQSELKNLRKELSADRLNLMTIHLFSTCPMGENRSKCVVNSHGKLHNHSGIYVNDASILPNAPGVNPQGTIMAIARRNVKSFLESQG